MITTARERFKAIARFQRPGDLYILEIFWPGTLANWVSQGAPREFLIEEPGSYGNHFLRDYFKLDDQQIITEVKSGATGDNPRDIGYGITVLPGSPLVPDYEPKIIADDELYLTYINTRGQVVRTAKGGSSFSMPMFLDWPVKDRNTWKEFKKRLDPTTPERWPVDWNKYVQKVNQEDAPTVLQVGGFFGYVREFIGTEKILYSFYDDPGLVEDIMDQMLYLEMEIIKKVVKDIKVDQAAFWEDMSYKGGSFISPKMVRNFMLPRYKKITDLLHNHGIDIIFVDSDGNVEQLIPIWLECGINYVWPLEQAAGNDVVSLRKKIWPGFNIRRWYR
jgi:hypothetical protein